MIINKENIEQIAEDLAQLMLRAEVLPDWQYLDCLEYVDETTARELGVVFADGKGYHWHGDIRGDEQDDAKVILIKLALVHALTELIKRKTDE